MFYLFKIEFSRCISKYEFMKHISLMKIIQENGSRILIEQIFIFQGGIGFQKLLSPPF